jgi:hypothetical protein
MKLNRTPPYSCHPLRQFPYGFLSAGERTDPGWFVAYPSETCCFAIVALFTGKPVNNLAIVLHQAPRLLFPVRKRSGSCIRCQSANLAACFVTTLYPKEHCLNLLTSGFMRERQSPGSHDSSGFATGSAFSCFVDCCLPWPESVFFLSSDYPKITIRKAYCCSTPAPLLRCRATVTGLPFIGRTSPAFVGCACLC